MEYMAPVLSVVFASLIIINLFWGIYIIKLNPKSYINKLFLAICIAMSIWSLGFSIGITAQGPEAALLWRRVSAIGWTSVYAIILHFLILLTYENKKTKKKKYLRLLYIPGFINIYVFSLSKTMAQAQNNLQRFEYGWVNIAINNGWDWFFYTYYALYAVVGLVVIWKWKQKLTDKKLAKYGTIIMVSFIAAFVLGSLVDVGMGIMLEKPFPQLAPIFILIPTWAMYYAARYYGLMGREKFYKDGMIVTDEDQKKIFKNIALALFLGGIISFVSELVPFIKGSGGDIKSGIFKGGIFSIVALGVYLFQKIKNIALQENLTIIILVLSIPGILFTFNDYAALTVWAFPIVIMMSSLIFGKRTLLISATAVAIVTQRLMWMLNPEVTVLIDKYDYIARIGVIATAFLIGYYVNRIYVAKIKENNDQIIFQKINSELSLEFVNINQENFDAKINKLLTTIGMFFRIDRTYIYLINPEKETMSYSYEWCAQGIEPEVGKVKDASTGGISWGFDQLRQNNFVCIEDVHLMPPEAKSEQERLIRQKVKSFVAVAVEKDNNIDGFIGFESIRLHKKWSPEEIKQLSILSNLISQGLAKVKDEKKIEHMAYYDALTRLPNRFLLKDRINQEISQAKKKGKHIAVIFLDLDNFKVVNDTIGHKGGDDLLEKVANKLKENIKKTDTVARFSGDEFMIMLSNISNNQEVFKVADQIMGLFRQNFEIQGQDFLVTSSGGIAMYPRDGEEADELIKNADTAMHKAKEEGKNKYVLCTDQIKEEVEMSIVLSNDLSHAIENNELVVYYQPQIDIASGEINGVEALLRWQHPERGIISPGVFIPLAEKSGLINSIGEWVLRTACVQNKKWQDMNLPPVLMAVNLSAIQLINPNIVSCVEGILKASNLPAKYLELEITESVAIKESIHIEKVLIQLKNLGVTIAIDDFGTEYSSLSRLKMLPIDRIKIDMQFTQGIERCEKDRAITMVIINLAKSLGLNVIAEGVESKGQLEFLQEKLCDDVQGYYYYKPMPADEIEAVLIERRNS